MDYDRYDYDDYDDYDDDLWGDVPYEDLPLYPPGKLSDMAIAELNAEYDRQSGLQGRLGDAEHINDMAVEEAEQRCRLVDAEIRRRAA
jgi:hypothetical protein